MRRAVWFSRWIGAAVAAVVLAAPGGSSSAAATQSIGVVDFAARPSLPNISGVIPGRSAADTTSALLERTAHPPVTVISRKTMTETERALGWRDTDITKFARLTELAERVGAAHLVIGTVDRLSWEARYAGTLGRSMVTVSIQLFTPAPPHITKADTGAGTGMSSTAARAVEQAMQGAVDQAVKAARATLPLGR